MNEAQTHAWITSSGSDTMFPTDNPTMTLPTYRAGLAPGSGPTVMRPFGRFELAERRPSASSDPGPSEAARCCTKRRDNAHKLEPVRAH
jgi:hypothetical protein